MDSLLIFLICLAAMAFASEMLTRGLEKIGARLRFTEGLLGIVTALGADGPEISSACTALWSGHRDLGIGVVVGSNVFNLAGLLGLSALVAGRVNIGREGLLFTGGTGLLVTVVVMGLLFGVLPASLTIVLSMILLIPYVGFTSLRPPQIARLKVPARIKRFLETAIGHVHCDSQKRREPRPAIWIDMVIVVLSITVVIASSIGAVDSAVGLAARWHLPRAVMGTLVLAALTSVPNVVAAIQLAREGRGAAVVSEALNSNTLNLLVGICLPALLFNLGAMSVPLSFATLCLLGMTLIALLLASHHKGLHRVGGIVLTGVYLLFVAIIVCWK